MHNFFILVLCLNIKIVQGINIVSVKAFHNIILLTALYNLIFLLTQKHLLLITKAVLIP